MLQTFWQTLCLKEAFGNTLLGHGSSIVVILVFLLWHL